MSSTLDQVDWNAELVRGDLGEAVQRPKREPGKGRFTGLSRHVDLRFVDRLEFGTGAVAMRYEPIR